MIDQDTRKNYFENLLNVEYYYHPIISDSTNNKIFKAQWLNSKLGLMLAIADDQYLYLLEFVNSSKLELKIKQLIKQAKASVIFKSSALHTLIQSELDFYFAGKLTDFTTPIFHIGSDFQKKIWQALTKISLGITCSYKELAVDSNMRNAYRAVANACGNNKVAIIIPCHRIVGSNNKLGGYSSGIDNKKFLLNHENKIAHLK